MPVLPFVGRADLLAELAAAVADARGGRGGLTLLTGVAGAGKTRVAEEAVRRAAGCRVSWLWCPPQGGGRAGAAALYPWSQAVRELAAADAACGRLVRASPGLRALLAGRPATTGGRTATERRHPAADPGAARQRLLGDLAELLRTGAAARPLLLVLDDVHEADATSSTCSPNSPPRSAPRPPCCWPPPARTARPGAAVPRPGRRCSGPGGRCRSARSANRRSGPCSPPRRAGAPTRRPSGRCWSGPAAMPSSSPNCSATAAPTARVCPGVRSRVCRLRCP